MSLVVEAAGLAAVTDLGRPGLAHLGIPPNGAADQHSARVANTLVGNADDAALVEVTGSALRLRFRRGLLVAVTGAARAVRLDGHVQPAWATLVAHPGNVLDVPAPLDGLRGYVAVGGGLVAERVLGSVTPDRLIGFDHRLAPGDRLEVGAGPGHPKRWDLPVFRLAAGRPAYGPEAVIDAVAGPELAWMRRGAGIFQESYQVMPTSDTVGLRLTGPEIEQTSTEEILSRGVPVGAIEVPPSGGVIMLLRGRLVTAGYPVVAVATTTALDRMGQLRPADRVRVRLVTRSEADRARQARALDLAALRERVRRALSGAGSLAGA